MITMVTTVHAMPRYIANPSHVFPVRDSCAPPGSAEGSREPRQFAARRKIAVCGSVGWALFLRTCALGYDFGAQPGQHAKSKPGHGRIEKQRKYDCN
jgi:hypothetical protein